MNVFSVLLLSLALLALVLAAARARELFVLTVRQGRTRVVRGRAPPALLEALADVFARAQVQAAEVKVLRNGDRARLTARGLDEAALQRARNVLGTFPAHKLVGARR